MSNAEELSKFVGESLSRGQSRANIESVLLKAGWPADQVRTALGGFADIDFPVPVPTPQPYLSARDAFQYLVLFSTLYVTCYHFGVIAFEMIERAFPDPAVEPVLTREYSRQAIRWSVSSLLVAFPVFLWTSRVTHRAVAGDPNRRISKTRRWLTYLTLFIAAVVLIGDFTTVVFNLLGGELTTRFVLKAATVGLIAGAVFWYYMSDLRSEEREARR